MDIRGAGMQEKSYSIPGVYFREINVSPDSELRTGIPLFIGYSEKGTDSALTEISRWSQFTDVFGKPAQDRYLGYAVRGFFSNGGKLCYVKALDKKTNIAEALTKALEKLSYDHLMENLDLVCAPDIMLFPEIATDLQIKLLDFCRRDATGRERHCFAILDSILNSNTDGALQQRNSLKQNGNNGALYYPWILVSDGPAVSGRFVPPCGHIAGVFARSDEQTGVHKAPANEVVEEAFDLEVGPTDLDHARLNSDNVNCLWAFPGRGIRVWGARTLSVDPAWKYVNVRRQFLTICRWIERKMDAMLFEPNDPGLWMRVTRELTAYLTGLYRKGAFRGATPEESFYVKCDAELNTSDRRDIGEMVVDVGLATALPGEFIVVRIVRAEGGVTITSAEETTQPPPEPEPSYEEEIPSVVVTAIIANPPGPDLGEERVLIRSGEPKPVNMTNWVLRDIAGHRFIFPRFILQPGVDVAIRTKVGENSSTDIFWGHKAALWNNTGDTALLYDSQDRLISTFVYKPK